MNEKPEKIIHPSGATVYRLNNVLHREDGPALIGLSGHKEWYINGKRYTEEDYIEYLLEYYPQEISIVNLLKYIQS